MLKDTNKITNFQKKVYSLCSKIPKGRVTTYKEIGDKLGKGGFIYRAVGMALNKNPYAPKIPCHRVVSSDGSLGGFAQGCRAKIRLLQKEGIKVKNNKIVNFEKVVFRLT